VPTPQRKHNEKLPKKTPVIIIIAKNRRKTPKSKITKINNLDVS